jgi:hypothetical protein
MTLGEILDFIDFSRRKYERTIETDTQLSAFNAFWSGAYSRSDTRLPENHMKAFPTIFGRTADGQIKADNWQESERALRQIAERFNQNKRR